MTVLLDLVIIDDRPANTLILVWRHVPATVAQRRDSPAQ